MKIEVALAALMGTWLVWSITSAKILRLVMTRDPERHVVLPLWAMQGHGYLALSIINFVLFIGQFGLPIAAAFSFPILTALSIYGGALAVSVAVNVVVVLLVRPAILRYVVAALLTIAAGSYYCAIRFS